MKGATALLIPGNMCDARMWRGGSDVIRRTLREKLEAEPLNADVFKDDCVEAMASRALSELSGPIVPVGFSMGAIVAMEMALQAPERITGLILSSYNAGSDLAVRATARLVQQEQVRGGQLQKIVVEELKPLYLAAANKSDRVLRELLLDMATALGPEVFLRQSEALRTRKGRKTELGSLTMPVLFVAGYEDRLCPPQWHVDWSSRTPNSQFIEIENAGHMAPLERPRQFANAIEQWIINCTERLAA